MKISLPKKKKKRKRKRKKILSSSSNKNYFILIIIIIFSLSIFVYMYMLSSTKSDDTYNNIKPGQVKNVNSLRKRGRRNSASNFPFIAGRKIHNKDCDSTQEQIFTTRHRMGEEMPIAIFVGRENLQKFTYRVLDSLKDAHFYGRKSKNVRGKRFCFLLIDEILGDNYNNNREPNIFLSRKAKRSYSKFCKKIVMLRIDDTAARSVALNIKSKTEMDPNDVGAKAMRLKKIWIFFMQKVFEYPLLHGYNGDIIFLEDDLIVSKDALTVLDFLSGCKNGHVTHIKNTKQDHYTHIHHTHFISLGGWGGENFVNAHPTLFTIKSTKYVPTMGYGFNRTLYNMMKSNGIFIKMISQKSNNYMADWSISLTEQLYHTIFMTRPIVLTLAPTLSRINHFATESLVGNSHHSIVDKAMSIPWKKFEDENKLLLSNDISCLSPYLYDWNGIPCIAIYENDDSKFKVNTISDVLLRHPWLKHSELNIKDVFNNVKCSFHDLNRKCDMKFKNYIEDCKEKNSFLFPLGFRHTTLSLSDAIAYWKKFGPAWANYNEKRLYENTMQ